MAKDNNWINRFIHGSEARQLLASVLEASGFKIVNIVKDEHSELLWGFIVSPSSDHVEILNTSREILVWASEFAEFQARTVMRAQEILSEYRPRLNEGFVLLFGADSDTFNKTVEISEKIQIHCIGFSFTEVRKMAPQGEDDLIRKLQTRFYSKDLYNISTAIKTLKGFFGRKSLISELSDNLKSGDVNIGLFGLRKMGKTSLIYRIIDTLKSNSAIFYAHVDVQLIDSVNSTGAYLLWSIGEHLIDSNKKLRKKSYLRLFGKHEFFSEILNPESVYELFLHDIRQIISSTNSNIIILFDEIELMSPESPGSQWGNDFIRIWRYLRAISQEHRGRLSFFVTGTNPHCIEQNKLDGQDNPAYNFFSKYYLPSLNVEECEELLSTLGRQMGLNWSNDALIEVVRLVGGHPFLLRKFGSIIHRSLLPRNTEIVITPETVKNLIQELLIELNSDLSQMIDVLADYYSDEFYILETFALGKVGEFRELVDVFPNDVGHLVGYGLIERDFAGASLNIELLQTWLQRQHAKKSRDLLHVSNSEFLPRGTQIENYEIIESIGRAGGFGRVYKAKTELEGREREVALKILYQGSLLGLQREVDVLANITHPNIVKFIDHGRLPSGPLYLAMELLNGPTLRRYCQRASRLSETQANNILTDLLNALISFHPDEEKLQQLRSKSELKPEELSEINRARHGYVHRDIKPENIIHTQKNGAVLIDFGISVRVLDAVVTRKATEGYLPPDGVHGQWTTDVDLYQLGITMLQVTAGVEYNGTNIDDLKKIVDGELGNPIKSVLLRMSSSNRGDRYDSAKQVLQDLSGKLALH
ncbi:MAG: protein kinase [Bacteroidota bacterium]